MYMSIKLDISSALTMKKETMTMLITMTFSTMDTNNNNNELLSILLNPVHYPLYEIKE